MYAEEDFISINLLQHYVFCPRQCALIVVEDAWRENVFTMRGNILHEKVDTGTSECRGTTTAVRSLRIHSYRLGITGKCDVVEFHRNSKPVSMDFQHSVTGVSLVPIEFKAGSPKDDLSDTLQLCAQALCLEEMLNTIVPMGLFFYGKIRRRVRVVFDEVVRKRTEETIRTVHQLVEGMTLPSAEYTSRCNSCSLYEICQPKALNKHRVKNYLSKLYES